MADNEKSGALFLIPTPLGGGPETLPEATISRVLPLRHFIVETGKVARASLKALGVPLQECAYYELNKRTRPEELADMMKPLLDGHNVGLLSDAGAPGVADPGAQMVERAHEAGIRVIPLVGPSAILLSLMSSGLNGQSFTFHGYLSPKRTQLAKDLRRLESESLRSGATQMWIEAPYRNRATVEAAIEALCPGTRFCVAVDLTLETEWIHTAPITSWTKKMGENLHKRPAMFLLLAK